MKVQQVMTREPVSCTPVENCAVAAGIMLELDVGCVPVVASRESERLSGIITDRDICVSAYETRKPLDGIPIAKAMSADVVCCDPVDEVADAEKLMKKARVRRLPVANASGRLLGIISLADMARAATSGTQAERSDVTEAGIGRTLSAICKPDPARTSPVS